MHHIIMQLLSPYCRIGCKGAGLIYSFSPKWV
jgi:hypothetical protein